MSAAAAAAKDFPLHDAAFNGNVSEVVQLLDTIEVNESGLFEAKPLHAASARLSSR